LKRFAGILVFLFISWHAKSQTNLTDSSAVPIKSINIATDTTTLNKAQKKRVYSGPRRATILSAVVPGLGQAYNKKYWKIPVVYGALGGFAYMFAVNNKEYNYYRKNLIAVNDDDSSTTNATPYNSDDLQILKLEYKKYRDFAAIGIGLVYLFNLIDANVDAHLKTFDVSDDLSIEVTPWQQMFGTNKGYKTATGLSLKFIF
jgi:hypothetical protein